LVVEHNGRLQVVTNGMNRLRSYDGILYLLKSNSGILPAFDAKSGKPHYQLQRLEGIPDVFSSPDFDASPALIDGEIFMRGYRYLYAIAAR
jgi:hypothetical protein